MDPSQSINELLKRHLEDNLTAREARELQVWADTHPDNQRLLERLSKDDLLSDDLKAYWDLWDEPEGLEREQRIFNRFHIATQGYKSKTKSKRLNRWLPYVAAAMLIFSAVGLYRYYFTETELPVEIADTDILPGGNRATLTLSDGRSISLNTAQSGITVGDSITYLDGTAVLTDLSAATGQHQTLSTPYGGIYHISLPDGTGVWLNAGSTLTFPDRFDANERMVELSGEAYFDVSPQHIPFKVRTNGQIVEVLGTEFNISAYPDQTEVMTTLVEGSIDVVNQISNAVYRVMPGQQAVSQGIQTAVRQVEVAGMIAWKEGRFSFDGKSFEEIIREMARWYNLDVEYEGNIPVDQFIGDAFRTDKLSTVLRFLESSNIRYRILRSQDSRHKLIIHNEKKEASD